MASRALHERLKRAAAFLKLPVRQGPLAGRRWILASGLRFWRGEYEPAKTRALMSLVRRGDVAFDVGAHVGWFTVLMSGIVGPEGLVIAFEPRPINRDFLAAHVEANRCANVVIVEAGVGARTGAARLETRTGTGTGRVSESGDRDIRLLRLDDAVRSGMVPPPDFVKIDVEGGEMDVLEGALETIEARRPRILLATHGEEIERRCRIFLESRGYTMERIDQPAGDTEWIAVPRGG